jgi:O-antigen/teichoic acid export membrane protein
MTKAGPRDDGRRWHRAGMTASAQITARVVTGVCVLVQTPLLLSQLGTRTFGWLMAVSAFSWLCQYADLGALIALQQQLAVAWAVNDDQALRRIFTGGNRLLSRLAVIWMVAGVALGIALGPRFLPAPDGSREWASWIAVAASVAVGLRFSAGPRLAAAVQAGWIAAGWNAAGYVLGLIAVIFADLADAPPAVFVAIIVAVQALPGAATEIHMRRRLGWSAQPADRVAVDNAAVGLWKEGLHYAFPSLSGAVLMVALPSVFAGFGGYAASAAFSVVQRLFGLVTQANALVLGPLWPAYAEAEATGNRAWISHSFRLSIGFTVACAAAVAVGAAGMPLITHFWLGRNAPPLGTALVWLLALWSAATLVTQALSFFLLGLGALPRIAKRVGIANGVTICATVVGGNRWGSTGAAAGLAAGCILLTIPLYVSCARGVMKERKDSTGAPPSATLA